MQLDKKNRIAFFTPAPKGISPGQRFRFEQYLDILLDNGIEVVILPFWDEANFKKLYTNNTFSKITGLIKGVFRRFIQIWFSISMSKTVFLYREMLPVGPPILEWILVRIFKKIVIELMIVHRCYL